MYVIRICNLPIIIFILQNERWSSREFREIRDSGRKHLRLTSLDQYDLRSVFLILCFLSSMEKSLLNYLKNLAAPPEVRMEQEGLYFS